MGYWALANVLNNLAKPVEAVVALDEMIHLDPQKRDDSLGEYGLAYTLLGRSQDATAALKPSLVRHPDDFWAHAQLAVDYMELGQNDAARAEVTTVLRLDPQFTVEKMFPMVGLIHKAFPTEIDRFRADLRKAGLK